MASAKAKLYQDLRAQVRALVAGEPDLVANAANVTALLFHTLPDLNWAGVYRFEGGELILGPFQGKPACTRIALGKGVCGTAALKQETVVVPNVHEFPGHIACDSASNAEIVVPLLTADRVLGVLDLDSPVIARFDEEDAAGLQQIAEALAASGGFRPPGP